MLQDTDLRRGQQTHPFALNLARLDTLRKRRAGDAGSGAVPPRKPASPGVINRGWRGSKSLLTNAERYLRLAASVYGFAPLAAQGSWESFAPNGPPQVSGDADEADAQNIAAYCGIRREDVVDVSEMRGDGLEMPRHAIVIHHETKSIVVAIRGTASVTDGLVHDLVCHDAPFLWGVAHAGIASAAAQLHRSLGPRLARWRARFPAYRIVVTGHSLGAGAACLLSILLFESSPKVVTKCYAVRASRRAPAASRRHRHPAPRIWP